MTQSIFDYSLLDDGRIRSEWWTLQNFGPNKPVKLIDYDNCRMFLGFSVQTDANHKDFGDKIYVGGGPGVGSVILIDSIGKGDEVRFELHDYDGHTSVAGEIWVENNSPNGHVIELVGTSCSCIDSLINLDRWGCALGSMYTSRTQSVVVPNGIATQLLNGNANRVAIILSVVATNNTPVGISSLAGAPVSWYGNTPPFNDKLVYRDYGPLISESAYAVYNGGPAQTATFSITEITKVGH